VHELYGDPEVVSLVTDRWGPEVAPGGVVSRDAIAQRAFADPAERRWLEELLWPRVGARVAAFREEAPRRDPAPRALVVETPLLFEAGMHEMYDATIAVVADDAVRGERAAARGHHGIAEREARQLSQQEKAGRATYAVVNDGSVDDLSAALADVLVTLDSEER
jgi:dephospho-CoA kinase